MTRAEWFQIYFHVLPETDGRNQYRKAWEAAEAIVKEMTGKERYCNYNSFKVAKSKYFAYGH
jgi:hypothetical protein